MLTLNISEGLTRELDSAELALSKITESSVDGTQHPSG